MEERWLFGDPLRAIEAVAASIGFEDPRQLHRLWRQSFGTSIAADATMIDFAGPWEVFQDVQVEGRAASWTG